MTTFTCHPVNFMPMEILEHIFSFLPVRDRHNVSRICQLWATAISSASVWSFTEVHCNSDKILVEYGCTSSSLLEKIQPYMGYIRNLKIVVDMSLELNQRLACNILDMMACKSRRLQGLQIIFYGKNRIFYSSQNPQQSLRWSFHYMDAATMQHINFRRVPFALNNALISLGRSSPNLRTLLINNHAPWLTLLMTYSIVEMLMTCPKLSTLGISYCSLSLRLFQELLRPKREPFKYLELFYAGIDNDIPDNCWTLLRQKHPGYRVGLEFAATVTEEKMTQVLKPYLPISQLHFNSFTHMANQVNLVANLYAGTLEKLVLQSVPSIELNMALIRLAKACTHLKEIHCFCVVSKGVVEAFRCHCPHLKKYTLSPTSFFSDNTPNGSPVTRHRQMHLIHDETESV